MLLCGAIALVALLYSSVGHAGASGYIAVLSLWGFTTSFIKPTALILNVLVACIGTFQFWRAGHFSWGLFWPFAALAVPAAFLGGYLPIPLTFVTLLLGGVLLASAARLWWQPKEAENAKAPGRPSALATGAGIGFLSGLTGTGGGIFLTPILLFMGWARTKQAAATSAAFILANSLAGLVGFAASGKSIPSFAWVLAVSAVAGGTIGSYLGSARFPVRAIRLLLGLVLTIAGIKLLWVR